MPKIKKLSKSKKILKWFKPTSPLKGMLLFAVVFAVVGGSYMAYKSFAATCTQYNFSYGSRGYCVADIQGMLKTGHGYNNIAVDGIFGTQTKNYVIWFQASSGFLKADGIVGPKTWEQLCNAGYNPPQAFLWYAKSAGCI